MDINEALALAQQEPHGQELLNVTGTIEADPGGKLRVYPDPFDLSRYVVLDRDIVSGEILDVTEHARAANPTRRGRVFAVPIAKGAEIQIVAVKTITITDVAKMRFLSLDQSGGGCGCGGQGQGHESDSGCSTGSCTTVEGMTYPCSETIGDVTLCSACCVAVTP